MIDANQINRYITEISSEIKMDTLDFTLKLCNLKLFAIQGSHLNSDGYEKLSKMINSDFETLQKWKFFFEYRFKLTFFYQNNNFRNKFK